MNRAPTLWLTSTQYLVPSACIQGYAAWFEHNQLPVEDHVGQSYRDLIAWQKGIELVTRIYEVTEPFPAREIYGLSNQLRRAAVSIPSNIAEGQARFSKKDFAHFLRQAKGSLAEVDTQIVISRNLKYLSANEAEELASACAELGKILSGLIDSQT
jgi:four helix bundle protein